MECPVCGLINPPDSSLCDCGYDFGTQLGGSRPRFLVRDRGVFCLAFFIVGVIIVAGLFVLGSQYNVLPAVMLLLIIPPHVALGIAWTAWGRSPLVFQAPRVRATLLFLGLVLCSLNVAIFWLHVIWLNLRRTDLFFGNLSNSAEGVCEFLNVFAILAGVFGEGRGRLALLTAAIAGWAIWITGHLGIL
jgi:hypothetical protein